MKRSKSLLSKETLLSVSVFKEPVQDFSFISQLLIKDEVCKIALEVKVARINHD